MTLETFRLAAKQSECRTRPEFLRFIFFTAYMGKPFTMPKDVQLYMQQRQFLDDLFVHKFTFYRYAFNHSYLKHMKRWNTLPWWFYTESSRIYCDRRTLCYCWAQPLYAALMYVAPDICFGARVLYGCDVASNGRSGRGFAALGFPNLSKKYVILQLVCERYDTSAV